MLFACSTYKSVEKSYYDNGNILRKDSQLKIYLELLDIKNRKVVWADSFKENIDNIFSLQDKMAMKIVEDKGIFLVC